MTGPRFAWVLPVACLIVSAAFLHISFIPLFVASGTGHVIWGPAIDQIWVGANLLVAVLAIAFTRRASRWFALVLWLATLAVLTHRVVDDEAGGHGVDDL